VKQNEVKADGNRLETLENDIVMEQPEDAYHLTGDAVALFGFFSCKTSDTVIDIGCGTGVLTLLTAGVLRPKRIYAVDINKAAVEQLKVNIALNTGKFEKTEIIPLVGDIREAHKTIGANAADAVICNPPYFSTGKRPKNPNKDLARHDGRLSLCDLAAASTKLLKYGGFVYFCYPANRTAKAIAVFENNNFRVKEIKFLYNKKGAYLVLLKCKKGGGDNTKIIF
jgi:tRNA1Val (adenine37-N6)-methyltransferase